MISEFLEHPMRVCFLLACVLAVFGAVAFFLADDFVSFHQFVFIGIFACAAYAGFLLTAIVVWCEFSGGLNPMSQLF